MSLRRRVGFVADLHGGGNRPCTRISPEIPRGLGFQIRLWVALAAVLLLPMLSSAAIARSDLCDLPIEVLLQLEFIPAARLPAISQFDDVSQITSGETLGAGAARSFPVLLLPGMQIHSLVLPARWGLGLPCFWVVVLDGSTSEGMSTNKPPHNSEFMTK